MDAFAEPDRRVILHFVVLKPDLRRKAIYINRQADLDFDNPEDAKAFVECEGITSAMIIGRREPSEFFDGKYWSPLE